MSRRIGAIVAILGGAVALGLTGYVLVAGFPRGLIVFAAVAGALAMAWIGVLRRGVVRGLAVASGSRS